MTGTEISAPSRDAARAPDRRPSAGWGLALAAGRVAMVAAACTLAWILTGLAVGWTAFPPPPLIATVAMLPVNIVCLLLVVRRLRREGRSAGELIGYRRGRLGRDVLWGMLWLAVLSVPFMLTIVGVMALLHGPELFDRFATVFVSTETIPSLGPPALFALALVTVLTFAPLNAPAEELVYRGYAQGALARRTPIAVAILLPAVLFALQHVWYAPTPDAVVVYVCAFFVWGAGAGVIAWRQGRLLPLIIAHGAINLFSTLPALAVPFLMPDGAS